MPKPKTGTFGSYKAPNYLKGENKNNYYERHDDEKRISIHKNFQLEWGRNYISQWRD